jgi:hypothetical protein
MVLCTFDVGARWMWIVHVYKYTFTISIWTFEIATTVKMAEPMVITRGVSHKEMDPRLDNNISSHYCGFDASMLMYINQGRKSNLKAVMFVLNT